MRRVRLTHECSCDAHNSVGGVQHAGILAAVLHAAVDAGEHSMPRVDKSTEAKGDWQTVQMQWGGLGHVDPSLNKIVHNYSCSVTPKTFITGWVHAVNHMILVDFVKETLTLHQKHIALAPCKKSAEHQKEIQDTQNELFTPILKQSC